ncbi:MAG TPA: LysM peptidoglycan-binding domain-containing protein [Candidatus Saccharimonadales bacterium]
MGQFISARRFVRYGLVGLNVLLLVAIAWFTLGPTHSAQPLGRQGVISTDDTSATEPLDQLSSADIAVTAAQAVGLHETTAVVSQAYSVETEQSIAPADTTVIAKPLVVSTPFKDVKDIKEYVVQQGDTVSSIAAKFSVTSDSIMWSNSLRGNSVNAGQVLLIPPLTGIIYTVRGGDSVASLAQKYRVSEEQIIISNDIELTGLKVGARILIPNGRQPAPAVFVAQFGFNGYDYGFCTWYVANRRAQLGRALPSNLGDAWTWDNRAEAAGMQVNRTPAAGAVAVTSSYSRPGHVAIVEAINADGSIWITEMNSRGQVSMTDGTPTGGWGRVDWKLVPADRAASYNYIH